MNTYRFDFVFSYWIFAWFILYEAGAISYSPKIALILGLLENAGLLFYFLWLQKPWLFVALFVGINVFLKILPLYLVRHDTIRAGDVGFLVCLFAIYLIWVFALNDGKLPWNKWNVRDTRNIAPGTTLLHGKFNKWIASVFAT